MSEQPADWYRHPDTPGIERYWDGVRWVGGPRHSAPAPEPEQLLPHGHPVSGAAPVGNPQQTQPAGEVPKYASWWQRLGAQLIDSLIIIAIPAVIYLYNALGEVGNTDMVHYYRLEIFIASIIFLLISFPYYLLTETRKGTHNGQTLGKQVMGIRVHSLDQPRVGAAVVIMREVFGKGIIGLVLSYSIPFPGGLIALWWYLQPLWHKKKQAPHDQIAKTIVVKAQ